MDVESTGFEMSLEEVLKDIGAEVPDVSEVIDGGSARVEADRPAFRIERGEIFEGA
jgi:hypothetical protein